MTTPTIIVYVRPDNTATLTCPSCGAIKQISAEQFRDDRHTMTVRCRCQATFSVQLDFRRHYRKQTSLHGTYEIPRENDPIGGLIQITNLSQTGIGFTVSGRHQIEKEQQIHLEFQLNDKNKTVLKKKAIVKRVLGSFISCEFIVDAAADKALGFYLRP